MMRRRRGLAWASLALALAACEGPQNMLDTAGPQAERIAGLWWLILTVSIIVWVLVAGAMLIAIWRRRQHAAHPGQLAADLAPHRRERGLTAVVGAAVALTVCILTGLTLETFFAARAIFAAPPEDALQIVVTGRQWWWQVQYMDPVPSKIVEGANEIHIPTGQKVTIRLNSQDVIHSFWVPNLHGKRDLIPGQETIFWIEASRPGAYRGQCAEFCGWQHAHMALWVVAEKPEDFQKWLEAQRQSAPEPPDALTSRGRDVFVTGPCALCHAVQGTTASARFGPNLTHLASRRTLAAGTLPNTRGHLAAWISDPRSIKPGNRMPATQLDPEDMQALLAWLETLR